MTEGTIEDAMVGTRSCASDVVGLRSRATDVARLEAVAALFVRSRLFPFFVRLFTRSRPMNVRRRTRGRASLPAPAERLGPIISPGWITVQAFPE